MDLRAFFAENVKEPQTAEITLSERFAEPFRLRAVSEEENASIRALCPQNRDGEPDEEEYLYRLTAACVTEPDLRDAELQRSWGVMGEAALLRRMLTAGEFARLCEKAQQVCGFDETVWELADRLKKESCRATPN